MNYHHLHFIYWLLSIFLLYHIHIITPSVSCLCFLFLYVLFVCWGKSILKNPAFPDAVLNFSEDICNGRLTDTQAAAPARMDGWMFGFGDWTMWSSWNSVEIRKTHGPFHCLLAPHFTVPAATIAPTTVCPRLLGAWSPKRVFFGFPTAQQVKAVQSLMNATDFSVMTVGKSSVSWWNMEYWPGSRDLLMPVYNIYLLSSGGSTQW